MRWLHVASRIIDYKIAMLIWLALATPVSAASVKSAAYACEAEGEHMPDAGELLANVIEETMMLEGSVDSYGADAG